MKTSWFVIVSSWLLTACGTSISFIPSKHAPSPPARAAHQVEIRTVPPARAYEQLGIIEVQQESAFSSDDSHTMLVEMRAEAGRRGCDVLLVQGNNDAVVGENTLEGYRGACLVYTGPAPTAPGGPPGAAPGAALPAGAARCIPNESRLCYGPGGCRGGQMCLPDGSAYTLCDCGT
jgi:hypothetical protein